jgi:hypothetical protein
MYRRLLRSALAVAFSAAVVFGAVSAVAAPGESGSAGKNDTGWGAPPPDTGWGASKPQTALVS